MWWRLFDLDLPQLLLVGLVLVVGVAVVVAASVSTAAFGLYNPAWEGTSELRALADDPDTELVIIRETERYEGVEAQGSVAVLIASEESYGPEDAERVRGFVEDGGTLVVGDAFGPYANPLLAGVGATARIDGAPLRDEREYYRSPAFPVTTVIGDHPVVVEADELTLNHGSAIDPGNATVLVASSEFAYLDRNRNEVLDDDETMEARAVVTAEPVGAGEVLVVSDPSVFINVMLDRPGNRGFAAGIIDRHNRVLFDVTHTQGVPPLALLVLAVRESIVVQLGLGIGVVGALVWLDRRPTVTTHLSRGFRWFTGRNLPEEPNRIRGVGRDELRAVLRERHPDWDEGRVERVIRAIMRDEGAGENDE